MPLNCKLLRAELRQNDDLSSLAVEELTLELLLTGAKEPWSPATPIPGWLRRIREILHEETDARLTLADLARSADRHPVQVCRQFHRRFSCTIAEYVRRIRVACAQSLLRASQPPVAQIALTCGFSDQSQFTTAFRRLTGLPRIATESSSMKILPPLDHHQLLRGVLAGSLAFA